MPPPDRSTSGGLDAHLINAHLPLANLWVGKSVGNGADRSHAEETSSVIPRFAAYPPVVDAQLNEAREADALAPAGRRDLGSTPNPFGTSANLMSYDGDRYSENLQPSAGM